jgi:hypothetical protein
MPLTAPRKWTGHNSRVGCEHSHFLMIHPTKAVYSGSVAFTSDRRSKVVHNLIDDKFDLYPSNSLTATTLAVSANSGRVKGAAFAESGNVLVCGADDGLLHIFDLVAGIEAPRQRHAGKQPLFGASSLFLKFHCRL